MGNENNATVSTASGDAPGEAPRAEFRAADVTVAFMLAGNAHVTFQSAKTGTRFTYHVVAAPPPSVVSNVPVSHFVHVLVGPDDYKYLGCIYTNRLYKHGHNSRIDRNAKSAIAFAWVWGKLTAGKMPDVLGVWHEGRCGKCGRRLTTPESIESGLGPICAKKDGGR